MNMVTLLPFRFQQCFLPSAMLLANKRVFLDIYLTTFFGASKFRNTSPIGSSLFWKFSKLSLNWQNVRRNWEKVFCFWNSCIWRYWNNLSLSRREYLSSAVNVFRNSPNILHITKREFFQWNSANILHITKRDFLQLNCLHNDQ